MNRWAIIHQASGAIIAIQSRDPGNTAPGLMVREADEGVSSGMHWWDGNGFSLRQNGVISLPVEYAEPGQSLYITKPEGSWYALITGEITNSEQVTVCDGYKENHFSLIGRYIGETRVEIISNGVDLVRMERDRLLDVSDKYVLPDYPISEELRKEWLDYRQALRDIPEMQPDATIETVVWPIAPAPPNAPQSFPET